LFSFDAKTGEEIFYWNATNLGSEITPNDVVVSGATGKAYVTDFYGGGIYEVTDADNSRLVTMITENAFGSGLGRNFINGIEWIEGEILLVDYMSFVEDGANKLFRVDIATGEYYALELPVGPNYGLMDGLFLYNPTTLYATTYEPNAGALKIVASDASWTKVVSVVASNKPIMCDKPTTATMVGDDYVVVGFCGAVETLTFPAEATIIEAEAMTEAESAAFSTSPATGALALLAAIMLLQ
jgi:DNA-binding beta-propeller fold protein YncE